MASCIDCRVVFANCPCLDLIFADSEEVDDLEKFVSTVDDVVDLGLWLWTFLHLILHRVFDDLGGVFAGVAYLLDEFVLEW